MSDENKKDETKVQADNNGIAVGSVDIAGSVYGTMIVGNDNTVTTGYTAEQVSVLIAQIRSTFQPKPFDGRCPYKGLDVFEEEDAELFFGREKLVDDIVSRVKDSRTVFVTGPSGSGKSSLVRAGLIHALKQGAIQGSERWLYATMKPGRDPIGELGRVIASHASSTNPEDEIRAKAMTDATIFARWCEIVLKEGRDKRIVLFIDQFEEVFTQINNESERVSFLNLLTHAATIENGRVIILFSMRSDFVSNCATYPQLNALLNQQFVQIGAMQPEELVSAIAQPALLVGLRIAPDLIAQIINEMKGEPGALPLMQFALKDLFDSQQEKSGVIALTLNDYLQRGGIHKALERHADDSFSKLSNKEQELARSIFSGLIEIGRGTQDTRRTALFDELIPANAKAADVEAIVQKLADARLVTTDEQAGKDTVTISHEKLIDAWPWLKKLVNENREVIALQNEISADAKEWEEHRRDASYLYSGARLENAHEQLNAKKLILSGTASEFIQAGLARKKRGQSALVSGISTIIVFLIIAVIVFGGLTKEAQKQSQIALARQLAAQAQSIYATGNSKQMDAVLLAIQSMRMLPSLDAAQILQNNTLAYRVPERLHAIPGTLSKAFSSDGKYVVFVNIFGNTAIHVQDVETGTEVALMEHEEVVNHVAFSPDGKYVASGSNDATARVWDAATGVEVARMVHDDDVYSVGFSPDNKYVVSGSNDATTRVWEAATGVEVARMTHDDIVYTVGFSPDGKYVVSGSEDNTARVWEAKTGIEIARMKHDETVTSVAFSSNNKYVVSGSADFTARVWEATTGTEIARMKHDETVTSVAFSPNSNYIVSGSFDTTARVWEVATGIEIARMTHDNAVSSVAFSPDGKYVRSMKFGNVYESVWEIANGVEITRVNHNSLVESATFSPDGKYLVSGSGDNMARVWDIEKGTEVSQMMHDYWVWSVTFSPKGQYVVSAGDNTARVWDAEKGAEVARMEHAVFVYTAVFSPDGKYVVSGGCDQRDEISQNCIQGSARVWDATTGLEIAHMVHDSQVYSVAFSPNGKYVVSGGCDQRDDITQNCIQGTARVWDVKTDKEVARMVHEGTVRVVAFSPDGEYVMSGSDDETARVWNTNTGKEVARMVHSAGPVTDSTVNLSPNQGTVRAIAFSPDGKYVVSGGCDQRDAITTICTRAVARVWETTTGKEVTHMEHVGQVNSVAFSLDGLYVVSGSLDGTARVWEVKTGLEIARMTHGGVVISVAFSPDGKSIVSAGCDRPGPDNTCIQGSARIWIWRSDDLIANACSRVTRNLTRAEWKQYIGDALPYQAVCPDLPIEAESTPTP